jgi:2-polyprenyl-6-methoxyphenol hydroxylase-like FAD-dependent oxidoreductase
VSVQVAIVGGGFAGACTAHVLASQGYSVALIDRHDVSPDSFRAEKIEPDQATLMRKLGLLSYRSPLREPIGVTLNYDGVELVPFDTVEQYGIAYGETVNSLRSALPHSVFRITDRVVKISHGPRPTVSFDGTALSANLIVMATGGNDKLMEVAGLARRWDRDLRSLSFGFDIVRTDGAAWSFRGFNYLLQPNSSKIDYLTIFPIGDRMRVNLFTQLDPRDSLVSECKRNPIGSLEQWFPNLREHIGAVSAVSTVQVVPTAYYRLRSPARAGVVVVGDEYQSVSPATGTGLSRVLVDVDVLCTRYAPTWLAGGRVGPRQVRAFYKDPVKVTSDRKSLDAWRYYRDRQLGGRVPLMTRVKRKVFN